MIRSFTSVTLVFLMFAQTLAQVEIYQDDFQKGYLKDGVKVKFWDYFNSDGELELKFNHSSNKIIYLKPDTSLYSIYDQGQWIDSQLDVYPRLIGSMYDFYAAFASNIEYPIEARKNKTHGIVYASFEIDTLGLPTSFSIYRDIGDGCGNVVLSSINSRLGIWIPAILNGKKYPSKFIFPVLFELEGVKVSKKGGITPKEGKLLSEIKVVGYGYSDTTDGAFQLNTNSPSLGIFEHRSLESALAAKEVARILYLRSSNIVELSPKIGFLNNLRFLDLGENQLNNLSVNIKNLKVLKELYLDNNNLNSLPSEISKLRSLEILSISSNNFNSLPFEIFELENLKGLDISDNELNTISPSISKLKNLEVLALENCGLTSLPIEIGYLSRLKELYITGNNIEPMEMEEILKSLPKLNVVK
jgi:hypothetical protein